MAKREEREQKIQATMDALGCTRQEAEAIIRDDESIDRNVRLDWEPSEEEEKAMRKATKVKAERKPRKTGPRERKEDPAKREVIAKIYELIKDDYENVIVSNVEKTIDFTIGDEKFTIDLKKHRKPKEK